MAEKYDVFEPGERVTGGPLLDFRDELVAAIERDQQSQGGNVSPLPPPRPRPRAVSFVGVAAAVVVLVVGIFIATVAGDRTEVAADITVERNGNAVTVSIENDIDVKELVRSLRDADVKATIERSPTGPSRVNRFVGLTGPPSSKLIGGDGTSSNKATFLAGSKVTLRLGVAANGRTYDVPTDAWAYREPLQGTSLEGKPWSEVGPEIEARAAKSGATLDFRGGATLQPVTPGPDDVVFDAQAVAADDVMVVFAP